MKIFRKINSIQKKLSIVTYVIVLIPVLILFSYINYNSSVRSTEEYEQFLTKTLNTVAMTVERKLYLLLDRSSYIKQHADIIDLLAETQWTDIEKTKEVYERLDKILVSYTLPFDEAKTEIIIYPINQAFPNTKYIGDLSQLKGNPIWEKINALDDSVYPCVWETEETENGQRLTLYRNIKNYSNETVGILEMQMDYRNIKTLLRSIELSNDGAIDYYTGNDMTVLGTREVSEKEYIFNEKQLVNGDVIRIKIPYKSLDKPINTLVILFALAVVIIIVHLIDKLLVGSLLKELNEFVGQIKSDSAYLKNEELITVDGNDEVAVIKKNFKDIIKSTRLVHEELDKADKNQRRLEFELLQTGINPHLLYNLLSIFRWKMLRQHQTEMVEIIDSMTKYYRLVLSGGKCFIKLKTELELIHYYVRISEYCHGNHYEVVTDIEEELLEQEVIKLILQPFVENAVMHGLNGTKNGVITIIGKRVSDTIVLTISDNGYGMDGEVLASLKNGNYSSGYGGYGIKNTNNRIKSFYGDAYGVEIFSNYREGTRVEITIPLNNSPEKNLEQQAK